MEQEPLDEWVDTAGGADVSVDDAADGNESAADGNGSAADSDGSAADSDGSAADSDGSAADSDGSAADEPDAMAGEPGADGDPDVAVDGGGTVGIDGSGASDVATQTMSGDTVDRVPDQCLSFEIRGEWGHFRRVEGNIVKQTYRIPPRTTVAGIVAAMLGLSRDSYYDSFGKDSSWVAVEPVAELRTMNVPQNTMSTAKEHLKTIPPRGHARISLPDPKHLRQQHNYELLVDPSFRVDLAIDDNAIYQELHNRLREGTSYYPPSLGLSEHVAEVEFLGEFDVVHYPAEVTRVDSAVIDAVDDVELEPGREVRVERSPGYMTADKGGRTTSEFLSIAYAPSAERLLVHDVETAEVDGRRVMFS